MSNKKKLVEITKGLDELFAYDKHENFTDNVDVTALIGDLQWLVNESHRANRLEEEIDRKEERLLERGKELNRLQKSLEGQGRYINGGNKDD